MFSEEHTTNIYLFPFHFVKRPAKIQNPSEILFTGGSLAPRIQNRKQYSIPPEVYLLA